MARYTNRHHYQRRISEDVDSGAFNKEIEWLRKQNLKGQIVDALTSLNDTKSSSGERVCGIWVDDYREWYNMRDGFGADISFMLAGSMGKLSEEDVEPVIAKPLKKYFTNVDVFFMNMTVYDMKQGGVTKAKQASINCSGFKGILGEKYTPRTHYTRRITEAREQDWGELEGYDYLEAIIDDINNTWVEIERYNRGAFTRCHTYQELGRYIKKLARNLNDCGEEIEENWFDDED